MHLSNILGCNANLSWRVVAQQVNDLTRTVSVEDTFKVLSERLLRHLCITSEVNVFSQTSLLPEYGHRASDLHMTYQEALSDNHDLLSLAEVCYIALVIDTTGIVASTSSIPHATRNKRHLHVQAVNFAVHLTKVPLNQRCKPSDIDFLPEEVAVQCQVPEVLMIASNQLERVSALLLRPGDASLP